jgi:hypothetical protein
MFAESKLRYGSYFDIYLGNNSWGRGYSKSHDDIRCHIGHVIFKRGQFSWESGYWDDDIRINSRDADGDWNSD